MKPTEFVIVTGRLVLLALVSLALVLPGPRAIAEQDIERSLEASVKGTVEVSLVSGSVEASCWPRAEVRVVASLAERTELIFARHGERVEVRVEADGRGRSDRSDLRLRVPCGGLLTVSTVSAEVRVEGDREELEISTVSGDVEVPASVSTLEVETVSGRVRLPGGAHNLEAQIVSGVLEIEGEVDKLRASAVSGRLEIEVHGLQQLQANNISGSIELDVQLQEAAEVEIENHSGPISLSLPAGVSAELSARTWSGPIDNRLDPTVRSIRGRHGGESLQLRLGDGRGQIDLETFSGEIRLIQRR